MSLSSVVWPTKDDVSSLSWRSVFSVVVDVVVVSSRNMRVTN